MCVLTSSLGERPQVLGKHTDKPYVVQVRHDSL